MSLQMCEAKKIGECPLQGDECKHAKPHEANMGCFWLQGKCQCVPEQSKIRCVEVEN